MLQRSPTARADSIVSHQEYEKFCEFFYRKTGIHFQDNKKYYVERRLLERIEITKSESFRNYFSLVRFQPSGEELQTLVNSMTVNETYFFREDYQLDALVEEMLPSLAKGRRSRDPIRIWSMPCSTGEEPYSIAISILQKWAQADEWDIEILASDIDTDVLQVARRGVYGMRSLQRVSKDVLARYFSKIDSDSYQICPELRESIDFSQVNIVNQLQTSHFRNLDVVFCRNLLIYFDDVARRETVEMLYEALSPGGFVCLGHSESMSRMTSLFTPRKFRDAIVYQKPPRAD